MTKFSDKTIQAAFKAFGLQTTTQQIVEKLQALAPTRQLNKSFMQIV